MLNMFEFGDINIKSVMTPLKQVVSSEVNEEIKSIIKKFHQSKFTRIPIYEHDSQNIIGILNIKDLIAKPKSKLNNLMRKVVYVYESDKASIVFEEMKDKQLGMVVVKNDNHEVTGIVTMEDLIEEIIGNMFD